ncbi:hypothetical protein CDAR_505631 [Caerostris darwini]|uniref:Uncharacterized protein n=1 Tax=Caerostris darwini TaxID=1538125 RepID=A0AAV4PQV7_9ARAC|nr:hypothetical protein CDAR_505631 [Caerostris darwini]
MLSRRTHQQSTRSAGKRQRAPSSDRPPPPRLYQGLPKNRYLHPPIPGRVGLHEGSPPVPPELHPHLGHVDVVDGHAQEIHLYRGTPGNPGRENYNTGVNKGEGFSPRVPLARRRELCEVRRLGRGAIDRRMCVRLGGGFSKQSRDREREKQPRGTGATRGRTR